MFEYQYAIPEWQEWTNAFAFSLYVALVILAGDALRDLLIRLENKWRDRRGL